MEKSQHKAAENEPNKMTVNVNSIFGSVLNGFVHFYNSKTAEKNIITHNFSSCLLIGPVKIQPDIKLNGRNLRKKVRAQKSSIKKMWVGHKYFNYMS